MYVYICGMYLCICVSVSVFRFMYVSVFEYVFVYVFLCVPRVSDASVGVFLCVGVCRGLCPCVSM